MEKNLLFTSLSSLYHLNNSCCSFSWSADCFREYCVCFTHPVIYINREKWLDRVHVLIVSLSLKYFTCTKYLMLDSPRFTHYARKNHTDKRSIHIHQTLRARVSIPQYEHAALLHTDSQ